MTRSIHVQVRALAVLVLLAACAPQTSVETNVQPTLFSATAPGAVGGELVLQGRYFGDGRGGKGDSYVILGADINGDGGGQLKAASWSPSKITLQVPQNAGYGFVFVVVDGIKSNGLPTNLP